MVNEVAVAAAVSETKVDKPHDKGYKKDLKNPKEFLHFLTPFSELYD